MSIAAVVSRGFSAEPGAGPVSAGFGAPLEDVALHVTREGNHVRLTFGQPTDGSWNHARLLRLTPGGAWQYLTATGWASTGAPVEITATTYLDEDTERGGAYCYILKQVDDLGIETPGVFGSIALPGYQSLYIDRITNHADAAVARLTDPFKGKARIEALVRLYGERIQIVEGVLWDVFCKRMFAVEFDPTEYGFAADFPGAEDAQLDFIGRIVGLARDTNQTDESYRADLDVWLKFLRSCGEPWRLLEIVKQFTRSTGVDMDEYYPAHVIFTFDGVSPSVARIRNLTDRAALGGVGTTLVLADLTDAFRFDGVEPGGGFGATADPDAGGKFATII